LQVAKLHKISSVDERPERHIALFCYPSQRGSKIERCEDLGRSP